MKWRWPWKRRPRITLEHPAVQALAESARKFEVAKQQGARVDHAVSKAEQLRRRNSFGPLFEAAFREHRR